MREPSMYRNTGRAEKEGAINEEKDEENAPLLAGHQDLAPNSDAARLCLDRPTIGHVMYFYSCGRSRYLTFC